MTRCAIAQRPAARARLARALCAGALCASIASGALAQAPGAPVAIRPAAQAVGAPVTLGELARVAVHPLRDAQATVVARNESRLSAEISARITTVEADTGQTVRKGQVLVRLDPTDATLALERARAQRDALSARLALASAQLGRATELQARGYISDDALAQRTAEVDALRAELRAAEVQARTARTTLDKTVIRAPFDGAVRARHAQLGELAAPGTPLITLSEGGAVEISAAIPVEDAGWLAKVRDFVFEGSVHSHEAKLLRLAPVVDRATRTREARLAPLGPAPIAGAEGRLTWSDPRPHVPAEVTVRRAGRIGVFVADGDKARFVAIEGAQEGRPAPITVPTPAALNGQIVVAGQQALQDGTAIAPR